MAIHGAYATPSDPPSSAPTTMSVPVDTPSCPRETARYPVTITADTVPPRQNGLAELRAVRQAARSRSA
ncbi:hypothetical protein GCM10020220_081780 [Nonomuraea rubra]